jgi:hypothetical protein
MTPRELATWHLRECLACLHSARYYLSDASVVCAWVDLEIAARHWAARKCIQRTDCCKGCGERLRPWEGLCGWCGWNADEE